MTFENKVMNHKTKSITKQQLEEYACTSNAEVLYSLVRPLVDAGLLEPMKNASTNGNSVYTIYSKYRIVRKNKDASNEKQEIQKLHPKLISNNYLTEHPDRYILYKTQLQRLSSFFFKGAGNGITISRKERSYEIFGEEKQLDQTGLISLLKQIGITNDDLAFYDTPEYCFPDYYCRRRKEMTVLICENKDIWFDIRKIMFEDSGCRLWGQPLDGILYGGGNNITKYRALTEYTHFMGDVHIRYLYWGDIDREGLNIYLKLIKSNPEISIRLFTEGYIRMMDLAENNNVPDSDDKRELMMDYSEIYALFEDEFQKRLEQYILTNERVPQEIINYGILKKEME